jgi:hypothetical protein
MYLSQKVGENIIICDSVSFSLLLEDHSYGKYNDGTGAWQHMVKITPGLPNDPDRFVYQKEISEMTYDISIYPNPSSGIISVSVDEDDLWSHVYSMDVIDISGKVLFPQVWLNNRNNNINLTQIHNGLYFIRIFKNRQLIYTDKLIMIK